jgi:hypothetical protein
MVVAANISSATTTSALDTAAVARTKERPLGTAALRGKNWGGSG